MHGLPALSVVTLGGDVVCLALVLWFWLSRERLAEPVRQMLAAAALYTVHDMTDVLGPPVPAARSSTVSPRPSSRHCRVRVRQRRSSPADSTVLVRS